MPHSCELGLVGREALFERTLARSPRAVPAVLAEALRESLRSHQEGRPADDDLAIVVVGRD